MLLTTRRATLWVAGTAIVAFAGLSFGIMGWKYQDLYTFCSLTDKLFVFLSMNNPHGREPAEMRTGNIPSLLYVTETTNVRPAVVF